ncbi:hypothetical protein MYOV085v1_p0125 [Vibrio phage 355E48.1]|nr:hypothetical protein MYOV085v1_p0125 [Vibrio phage 355E48.1]
MWNKIKEILGFENTKGCVCGGVKPQSKSFEIMDYTPLLQLISTKDCDRDEYYLTGFGGMKFEDRNYDLNFRLNEDLLLHMYGTGEYETWQQEMVEGCIQKCNTIIEAFDEETKGNDITYAQTQYEDGECISEGWKLFRVNGEWKLCVSYRLM